ncbi:hypothetical protein OG965_01935 [Streptomyces sp. NBC_00224]|uniref:Uncharacterized protein n=2 Tax=Streptomyces TaxID=1883 RepID=A0AAU2HC92_9ACTN
MRRLVYRRPAMLQLTLYQPDRLTGILHTIGTHLARRPVAVFYAVLVCSGLITTVLCAEQLHSALAHRNAVTWLLVYATMIAVNVGHEFGHATALAYFGGRPRRMGVMLLYLSPAFFCDVTSSWCLPRRQRATVALAGIIVNTGVGACAALAGAADLGGQRSYWWLLALANTTTVVFNLLPFIRLDGYLLLLATVDRPHLRDHAMDDARAWLGHHLYRHPPQPRRLPQLWSVPYGLAALTFPAILIAYLLLAIRPVLAGIGPIGTGLWITAALCAAARLLLGCCTVAFPRDAPPRQERG